MMVKSKALQALKYDWRREGRSGDEREWAVGLAERGMRGVGDGMVIVCGG